jgi:hypothetical protein
MTQTATKLSDTARAVLEHAATREDHLVRPPSLPAAARQKVIRSLLNRGLVEEVPAPITDGAYARRRDEDGAVLMLRATPAGLTAIGLVDAGSLQEALTDAPTLPDTAEEDAVAREAAAVADALDTAPTAPARATLRQAAEAVLAAWSDESNRVPLRLVCVVRCRPGVLLARVVDAPGLGGTDRAWPCAPSDRASAGSARGNYARIVVQNRGASSDGGSASASETKASRTIAATGARLPHTCAPASPAAPSSTGVAPGSKYVVLCQGSAFSKMEDRS